MDFLESSIKSIEDALDTIFGPEIIFLSYQSIKFIQIEMLKDAFRKKAKIFHPDRAKINGINEVILCEKFKKINNAYHFLLSILKDQNKLNEIIKNNNDFNSNFYKKNYNDNKKDFSSFYYEGNIPKKKLRFAEFLFYSKIIDWKTMINALIWQYKVRPRIGEIALSSNFINKNDILFILKNLKYKEMFGECAVRLGFLTKNQLNIVLWKQKSLNYPIGRYFIENNILSNELLDYYLEELKKHNYQY